MAPGQLGDKPPCPQAPGAMVLSIPPKSGPKSHPIAETQTAGSCAAGQRGDGNLCRHPQPPEAGSPHGSFCEAASSLPRTPPARTTPVSAGGSRTFRDAPAPGACPAPTVATTAAAAPGPPRDGRRSWQPAHPDPRGDAGLEAMSLPGAPGGAEVTRVPEGASRAPSGAEGCPRGRRAEQGDQELPTGRPPSSPLQALRSVMDLLRSR